MRTARQDGERESQPHLHNPFLNLFLPILRKKEYPLSVQLRIDHSEDCAICALESQMRRREVFEGSVLSQRTVKQSA